jgi:hypothetical protein
MARRGYIRSCPSEHLRSNGQMLRPETSGWATPWIPCGPGWSNRPSDQRTPAAPLPPMPGWAPKAEAVGHDDRCGAASSGTDPDDSGPARRERPGFRPALQDDRPLSPPGGSSSGSPRRVSSRPVTPAGFPVGFLPLIGKGDSPGLRPAFPALPSRRAETVTCWSTSASSRESSTEPSVS